MNKNLCFHSSAAGRVSSEKENFDDSTMKLTSELGTTELPEKKEIPREPRSLRAKDSRFCLLFARILNAVAVRKGGVPLAKGTPSFICSLRFRWILRF